MSCHELISYVTPALLLTPTSTSYISIYYILVMDVPVQAKDTIAQPQTECTNKNDDGRCYSSKRFAESALPSGPRMRQRGSLLGRLLQ